MFLIVYRVKCGESRL